LADRLQTPIFVLEDLDIGMNDWLCEPFSWDDACVYDRGKVMSAEELEARGSSRDRFAKYSEEGPVYQDNMQRLLRKFETAKSLVPAPIMERTKEKSKCGVIYFGSSAPAVREALAALAADDIHLDTMRLRAFPFPDVVTDFINAYDQVFLVEQNRDAQMRSLLVNECGIDPARFISILHFDGTPITARYIISAIAERLSLSSKEAAE
jgi:2-oxoglutarate ferredoxin oxidoreductase subunit alpha